MRDTCAVRYNLNREKNEKLFQRKYFPPYNLAQDLYDPNEDPLNKYNTKKRSKAVLPPIVDYLRNNDDNGNRLQTTKDMKDTKLLSHNLDEDYKDYFFLPNYDEKDLRDFFGNEDESYDSLGDFILPDPLNYDVNDVGNNFMT